MAKVYIGSASVDERGKAHGGAAGNQTGRELKRQAWYAHSKGWRVFRAKDAQAAERIAACMAAAVANRHIGYDQHQRNTLYAEAAKVGFDVSKVTADCETDCSALVRVCCAWAGIMGLPEGFRTTNEPKHLLATGAFTELTGDRYTKQSAYLRRGDILCTATQGHTAVVLTDGVKAEDGALSRGDSGAEVAEMQRRLLAWRADCLPKCGADGDFGEETERALRAFQKVVGLEETGALDIATRDALWQQTGETVRGTIEITGGSVNVRSGPGTSGTRVIGVVHAGDRLDDLDEVREAAGRPWYRVDFLGAIGWVSSRYARRV